MITTLALLGTLALAPAQKDELKFEGDRFTFGQLGQTRKSGKYLPGDKVYLAAAVKGLTVDKAGMIDYSMGFEITKKGQKGSVQKRDPIQYRVQNSLGGSVLPIFAEWPIPRDNDSPGDYTMKITCIDKATKKTVTLNKEFTVEKTKFGFIQTHFLAPSVGIVGQTQFLQYALVGFELDKAKKTDVTITIRVLDDKDKPTVANPLTSTIKGEATEPGLLIFRPAQIEMNRPGKFKVEVTAKCNLSKDTKPIKEVFDLTVVEVK